MQMGMIELGRMGVVMTRQLLRAGHDVVVQGRQAAVVDRLAGEAATAATAATATATATATAAAAATAAASLAKQIGAIRRPRMI